MSLKPSLIEAVPEETARIARAAFPKGNLYISMRDQLGTLFADSDFTALYPKRGQPAFAPWRLALITIMQFLENLSDRQTAEAVRSRIDWKYVLSLELTDSGFDYSILSGFRQRLITSSRQSLMFDRLIELLRDKKLLKERGTQRTDSTHVLASIRVMNRLEVVTETMRAALNQLAILAPAWLKSVASPEWQIRYCSRAEQSRFPTGEKASADYGKKVGSDGSHLLKLIETEQPDLARLEIIETLRKVWAIHYSRYEDGEVCWRTDSQLPKGAAIIESPYDTEARHSKKRGLSWTGYKVHLTETCDEALPHLITNVQTTVATEQDVACTAGIEASLAKRNLLPSRHLVDAGYIDAELLVASRQKYEIELFGPPRSNSSWQARERGYDATRFQINWDRQAVVCPEGKSSSYWHEYRTNERYPRPVVKVKFKAQDCRDCSSRTKCVRNKTGSPRQLLLPNRELHQALENTRISFSSDEGQVLYKRRAGIEATISQAVRRGSLRRSRYKGLQKTHFQETTLATGINILRTLNFLTHQPLAKTRVSRFVRLMN